MKNKAKQGRDLLQVCSAATAFLLMVHIIFQYVQRARSNPPQLSVVPVQHLRKSALEPPPPVSRSDLDYVITQASERLWKDRQPGQDVWIYPPTLGPGFDAVYYFTLVALGKLQESQFNQQEFTKYLLDHQRPDGTWDQAWDSMADAGDLDTTILVYWYLKTICPDGDGVCSETLKRVRGAVLELGGVRKAQTMTKFKLASMGHYPWEDLKEIPLLIFQNRTMFHRLIRENTFDKTAQWVPGHLKAMAYLKRRKVVLCVGKEILELFDEDLQESYRKMRTNPSYCERKESSADELDQDLQGLMHEILNAQLPLGSFGAYTVATELTLFVMQDIQAAFPDFANAFQPQISNAERKAFQYLERFKLADAGASKYGGILMDGRWWDTLLVSWALIEAGTEPAHLNQTATTLVSEALQPSGGVAYGYDFEYAPDTDDTSFFILLMYHMGSAFKSQTTMSKQWLETKQNEDGGFPAFHKGKNPFWSLGVAFEWSGVANSAEVFDISCADLTGHTLEALGTGNGNYTVDHPVVAKAIDYLKATQTSFGGWEGRWGINNIYAIGAVIPGLKSVGVDLSEPWIVKTFQWLLHHQNADGGFGESPKSYSSDAWAGIGNSTITQTSWALFALLEAPENILPGLDAAIDHAVWFLLNSFHLNGEEFEDISVVGTGHRAILNLQYPAYAKSFSVVALARYKRARFDSAPTFFERLQ